MVDQSVYGPVYEAELFVFEDAEKAWDGDFFGGFDGWGEGMDR